eukprot:tig00021073_g18055.t1
MLKSLAGIAERWRLDAELVVVEWNPPPAAPPLHRSALWPATPRLRTRIVTVPPDLHARLALQWASINQSDGEEAGREAAAVASKNPVYEWIAKNAGVRRAAGDYVLVFNVDDAVSDAVGRLLGTARGQEGPLEPLAAGEAPGEDDALRPGRFYLARRYHLDPLPAGLAWGELQARMRRESATGIFYQEMDFERGFLDTLRHLRDANVSARAVAARKRPRSMQEVLTDGPGDFFLMHRDDWHATRGFREVPTYCCMDHELVSKALAMGLQYVQLLPPYAVFHANHEREYLARKTLAVDVREQDAAVRSGVPLHQNGPAWGLAGERGLREAELPGPLY